MKLKTVSILVLLSVVAACGTRDDIVARYRLEKLVWQAREIDRRLTIDFLRNSERDIELMTGAFETVVAGDPLPFADTGSWDSAVVKDIKTLVMGSKITLAHLHLLGERYFQSGIHFRIIVDDPVMIAAGSGERKLELARTLYGISSGPGNEIRCERYFKEVVFDDDFWNAPPAIRESFLDIPLVLARIYKCRRDRQSFETLSDVAESFYTKVIRVWPDSLIAEKARFQKVQLMFLEEDWVGAMKHIDEMTAHTRGRTIVPRLLLMKGRIAEVGLRKRDMALQIYSALSRDYPDTPEAYSGDVSRAMILAQAGNAEQAKQLLRSIEKNEDAPDEVRSLAMLERAIQLDIEVSWNESMLILRRLQNQYPFTEAALEAPLIITSHYITAGDTTLAIRNLERSTQFYLSLIERKNTLFERGLLPEDYLIENYLLADRSEEIAAMLVENSHRWGWSSNAGALLKSAHIYANIIGDRERSKEILKKCLALFLETRYSGVARNSLAILEAE